MTLDEFKALKDTYGFTVKQLSERSGVPIGTIQKLLTGETKHPRYNTLKALEKVFDEEAREKIRYDISKLPQPSQMREATVQYGAKREKRQGEYTIDDYYLFSDDIRVELIDGVIYYMSSPLLVHQAIAGEIYRNFINMIRGKKGSCLPFISPVDVKLGEDNRTMVQPDVIIVCDKDKLRSWGIEGAPDFLLEVLSPSTRKKDMTIKLNKYSQSGVREYWMIDPQKKQLITCVLEDTMEFSIRNLEGEAEISIFSGELKVDLSALAEMIQMYDELTK